MALPHLKVQQITSMRASLRQRSGSSECQEPSPTYPRMPNNVLDTKTTAQSRSSSVLRRLCSTSTNASFARSPHSSKVPATACSRRLGTMLSISPRQTLRHLTSSWNGCIPGDSQNGPWTRRRSWNVRLGGTW